MIRDGFIALIGDPVAHSASPRFMGAALRATGHPWPYVAMRVVATHLGEAVAGLHALGAVGFNVTMPHKRTILPLLASVTADAALAGAVNTVIRGTDDRWTGYNTDITGIAAVVDRLRLPDGFSATVLGSGGAARAAIIALATRSHRRPSTVYWVARRHDPESTLHRAIDTSTTLVIEKWPGIDTVVGRSHLVINATPLGWTPADAVPWTRGTLARGQCYLDLNYPAASPLQNDAKAQGARVVDGRAALLEQGLAGFTLFTGMVPPRDIMRRALRPPRPIR